MDWHVILLPILDTGSYRTNRKKKRVISPISNNLSQHHGSSQQNTIHRRLGWRELRVTSVETIKSNISILKSLPVTLLLDILWDASLPLSPVEAPYIIPFFFYLSLAVLFSRTFQLLLPFTWKKSITLSHANSSKFSGEQDVYYITSATLHWGRLCLHVVFIACTVNERCREDFLECFPNILWTSCSLNWS